MLGCVSEAEDMVQETWLRWQKQTESNIQSPKAWLVSTITRLCIDQLRSARRGREEYRGVWLPEPLVESPVPAPDESAALTDSLTIAFMLMLETLQPPERAVFLLREVFNYDYAEVAGIVGKSETNCRQIVRRAKAKLAGNPPAPPPPTRQARRIVEQFVEASTTGRVDDLLALLAGDAVLYTDGGRLKSARRPILGADRICRFFVGIQKRQPADARACFAWINGRAGILLGSAGRIYNATTFDLEGNRVRKIYLIRNPDKLRHLANPFYESNPN